MVQGMKGAAYIGLENPKTSANVGAALRAAQCLGARFVGISGKRLKPGATDTMKAHRNGVGLLYCSDVMELCPYRAIPIAIEITPEAESLVSFTHPKNAFYVFGPEDGSVKKDTISRCAKVIRIPSASCLNLAATVNVVLYDRLAKQGSAYALTHNPDLYVTTDTATL